jgi:site-specific recombinase XerC
MEWSENALCFSLIRESLFYYQSFSYAGFKAGSWRTASQTDKKTCAIVYFIIVKRSNHGARKASQDPHYQAGNCCLETPRNDPLSETQSCNIFAVRESWKRAKEIASLTWSMVTDANGEVADEISLPNSASKDKGGGRTIPLNSKLKVALVALYSSSEREPVPHKPVICSERGRGRMSAASITVWFHRLYNDLGLVGCSSHSGRRTSITRGARRVVEVGGSLRDIQQLAGHSSLGTTQRYIEGNSEAKRKLVNLI